jgi:hypothetical protein
VVAQNPPDDEPDGPRPDSTEFHIEKLERDSYRKFCIARLISFLDLRAEPNLGVDQDAELRKRILERAIYSAFRDCVEAGARAEARRILDEAAMPAG